MAQIPLSLRIPASLVRRADALVRSLAKDPEVVALGTPSRSHVIRLAITHGLTLLESKYGKKGGRKR